jgi:hypothetical protein
MILALHTTMLNHAARIRLEAAHSAAYMPIDLDNFLHRAGFEKG